MTVENCPQSELRWREKVAVAYMFVNWNFFSHLITSLEIKFITNGYKKKKSPDFSSKYCTMLEKSLNSGQLKSLLVRGWSDNKRFYCSVPQSRFPRPRRLDAESAANARIVSIHQMTYNGNVQITVVRKVYFYESHFVTAKNDYNATREFPVSSSLEFLNQWIS